MTLDAVINVACVVLALAIVLILTIVWQEKNGPQRQRHFPPPDSSRAGVRGVELFTSRTPGGFGWRARFTRGVDPGGPCDQPGSDVPPDSSSGGHGH